ncbi:MAG TPA: cation diffusion facilitator family transporter [Gammaproteobacteria bacterium]|nr:cation diffusion facilitator family transporter [Gammaproteobacteria bacterium]
MEGSSRLVVLAALSGNAVIAVIKFIAALLSGSAGMFSEGIHSTVDTINQALLLYGMHRAKRPADEDFPFGYGKEVYFWSFVVAVQLFGIGAVFSVYDGVQHIVRGSPLEDARVSYIVLGLALVFEGSSWGFAVYNFSKEKGRRSYFEAIRRGKDPTMFMVIFEDTAAILGIAVAFLGVFLTMHTGDEVFDGIASILIGVILGVTAALLGREVKGLLIGESANRPVVRGIRELALSFPEIEAIHETLTMHVGPNFILVNISVAFKDDINAHQVADAAARLDSEIKARFRHVKRVFIEAETGFRPIVQSADQRR